MKEIPDIIRELKLPGNYSNMPLFNLPDVFKIYVEDSMYKEIYDSYASKRQQTGDLYLDLNSGFLNKCDIATTMEELGLDVEREDGRYVE